MLAPSKSRFSTSATCVAHIGPFRASSFTISHRSGLPSAAKNRAAPDDASADADVADVAVGTDEVEEEVGLLMPAIQPVSPDPNKLNIDPFWRKLDFLSVDVDQIWRKIDCEMVKIDVQLTKTGESQRTIER